MGTLLKTALLEGQDPTAIDPHYIEAGDYNVKKQSFGDLATLLWVKSHLHINGEVSSS